VLQLLNMMTNKLENGKNNFKFYDQDFFSGLIKLGLPIAFQQLLFAVFSVVDTSMIAQLGAGATAGVGAAVRVFLFMLFIHIGIVAATTSLTAQYWGIKDYYNIRRTTGMSISISAIITTIFSIVMIAVPQVLISIFTDDITMIQEGAAYLRIIGYGMIVWGFLFIISSVLKSMECVKIPLVASIMAILVNVFLNWVFIFGHLGAPKMGVQGAALGTTVSYYMQSVIIVLAIVFKKHPLTHHLKEYFLWTKDFIKKFLKIMTPAFLNEVFWGGGTLMYALVLGRYGNVNFGSYTLFNSVESMFFTFFIGLGTACSVLIGKELGRGNIQRGWNHSIRTVIVAPIVAIVLGLIVVMVRYPVLSLMQIPDINMVNMTAKMLVMYAFLLPTRVLSYIIIVGIFRSGGDTMSGLWIDTSNVWLVGVPLTLIGGFILKLPFQWVFLLTYSEDVVKIIFCFVIFFKKKWINQLTHDSEMFVEDI